MSHPAILARQSLADALRTIRAAQSLIAAAAGMRPDLAAHIRKRAAIRLAQARAVIAAARSMYARAMADLAKRGELAHRYGRSPRHGSYDAPRWIAVVSIGRGGPDHVLPRTYGRRQSAQRAAARYVARLVVQP